jgi:preprotein translocase subunit SecB
MAEFSSNDQSADGAVSGAGRVRRFVLRQLYIKDLSFEAPFSPGIFEETGLPEADVKLNLRTASRDLGRNIYEVVLHIDVKAVVGERTIFLVELAQAGRFHISGYTPEERRTLIGVTCPTELFPFAREVVSSMVYRGGFSAVLLLPVDFAALFSAREASRAAAAPPAKPA